MILLAAAATAAVTTAALLGGTRGFFARDLFMRANYRGERLPTAVGLLVPIAASTVLAAAAVLSTLGWDAHRDSLLSLNLTVTAAFGFGFLGLLDDLAVDRGASGYRGHLRALSGGNLSAGALKMLAGPVVALVVVNPLSGGSFWRLVADGAVVALAANLANLFDRAPGRVSKVFFAVAVVLVVASGASAALAGLAAVGGAALVLFRGDLSERFMLGDAGANPLGAAAGLAVVLAFSPGIRDVVLIALFAMNLLSEWVSFSSVIERVGLLRALDTAGRRR